MTVYVQPMIAEVAVASNVIEVALHIDDCQAICRPGGQSITVDGSSAERARAGIDDQREIVAANKTGIDAPRHDIAEPRHGVTMFGHLHGFTNGERGRGCSCGEYVIFRLALEGSCYDKGLLGVETIPDFDVLVAGGGNAGLCAALSA